MTHQKADAFDIQVLAGAFRLFAGYIAMADDIRRTEAGHMADEHRAQPHQALFLIGAWLVQNEISNETDADAEVVEWLRQW